MGVWVWWKYHDMISTYHIPVRISRIINTSKKTSGKWEHRVSLLINLFILDCIGLIPNKIIIIIKKYFVLVHEKNVQYFATILNRF